MSGPKTLQRVEGYVWCDLHGEIHDDTLDPYDYGDPKPNEEDARCVPANHRAVYARLEPSRG